MIVLFPFGFGAFAHSLPDPAFNDWFRTGNFTDSQIFSTSTPETTFVKTDYLIYILLLVGLVVIIVVAALAFWYRARKRLKKRELTDIEEVMLPAPGESYDIAHV
jgi:beta-lactamase regulating signal transducer with metallopeptidase domain